MPYLGQRLAQQLYLTPGVNKRHRRTERDSCPGRQPWCARRAAGMAHYPTPAEIIIIIKKGKKTRIRTKKKKSKGNKFIAPHERRSSRQSPPTRLPASLRAVPRHPREGSRPRLPLRPAAPRPPRHEGYSGRRGHGAPPPRTRGAAAPPEGTRRGSPSPHPGARTDPSAAGRSAASLPFPGERRLLTPSGGFPEFLGGGGAPPG